jgi:NADH-quinone oxidoreductase subunit L
MFRLLYLTFFNDFHWYSQHKICISALITFPLIVLAILAAVGGLISFPTNSWLVVI